MRLFLLLPLLLGFSVLAIAHNKFNSGDSVHYYCDGCGVIHGTAQATDGAEPEEEVGREIDWLVSDE